MVKKAGRSTYKASRCRLKRDESRKLAIRPPRPVCRRDDDGAGVTAQKQASDQGLADAGADEIDQRHRHDHDDDDCRGLGRVEATDALVKRIADAASANDAKHVAERTLVSKR